MAEARKTLIVEDEIVVAMELQSGLTSLGHEVPGIADTGEGECARGIESAFTA